MREKMNMNGKNEEPTILNDAWQEGIAEDARANGFIALDHLGFILAKDEQYGENLPYLWDYYDLNQRGPEGNLIYRHQRQESGYG
jgi:hypothetical protein